MERQEFENKKRKNEENKQLKQQVENARNKLFNILTEYEIGNYDSKFHNFYEDVYDVHNELMELAEWQMKKNTKSL